MTDDCMKASEAKRPYAAPTLTTFGGMAALTASGTGTKQENPGADADNNAAKFA